MEKVKKIEKATGTPKQKSVLLGPALLGAGIGILLLCLLIFITAGLIWSGGLPGTVPSILLSACAGVCAFAGGRFAVKKSSGSAMLASVLTTGLLAGLLAVLCLGPTGELTFPGRWTVTLLLVLAGGLLSGLMGRRAKRGRRGRK